MNEELEKRVTTTPNNTSSTEETKEVSEPVLHYRALKALRASKDIRLGVSSSAADILNAVNNNSIIISNNGVVGETIVAGSTKKKKAKAKLDQTVYILDRQGLIKTYVTKIVNKQWFDKNGKKKKKKSYVVPDDEVGEQVEKTSYVADDFGKIIWTSQKKAIKAWKKISKYARKNKTSEPEEGVHPTPTPDPEPSPTPVKAQPILKYDPNGGSGNMDWVYFTAGTSVTIAQNQFTKANANFMYWNSAADGSGVNYTPGKSYIFNSNMVLYAQWSDIEEPVSTITIKYNGNGSTGGFVDSVTITPGSAVRVAMNGFTKNNYTFINWNSAIDGSGADYTQGKTYDFSRSVTLFAQWQYIPPKKNEPEPEEELEPTTSKHTLKYFPNGGTGSMDPEYFDGAGIVSIAQSKFTKENADFSHWNTKTDGTGEDYIPGESYLFDSDINLYAIWSDSEPETPKIVRYYTKKGLRAYRLRGFFIDEDGNIVDPEDILRYIELYDNASLKDGIQRVPVKDEDESNPINIDIEDIDTDIEP